MFIKEQNQSTLVLRLGDPKLKNQSDILCTLNVSPVIEFSINVHDLI